MRGEARGRLVNEHFKGRNLPSKRTRQLANCGLRPPGANGVDFIAARQIYVHPTVPFSQARGQAKARLCGWAQAYPEARSARGRGGIGRHARFRFWWLRLWGFKSLRPHQRARLSSASRVESAFRIRFEETMQITETSNEGLKRTLKVVVGADELGRRFTERLGAMKDRVQLKGFRKGKVPEPHLRKMFGRSLMAEVLQDAVKETSSQAIADRKERPAMQPNVSLPEDQAEIERVLAGEADLAYSDEFRGAARVRARRLQVAEARAPRRRRGRRRRRQGDWRAGFAQHDLDAGRRPRGGDGDRVTVDFAGKIDGEAFEGGTAEDAPDRARPGRLHTGLRGRHHGRQGWRGTQRQGDVPGRLSRCRACRQGGGVRRQGQGGRRALGARDRR